jgi:hypothetical protein
MIDVYMHVHQEAKMKKPLTALVAAGSLALATVATTQPARAMDPWTAAAWFVGGLFVGGWILAPAFGTRAYAYAGPYGSAYGYSAPYGYSGYGYAPLYASYGASQRCYPARVQRQGVWHNIRVCY